MCKKIFFVNTHEMMCGRGERVQCSPPQPQQQQQQQQQQHQHHHSFDDEEEKEKKMECKLIIILQTTDGGNVSVDVSKEETQHVLAKLPTLQATLEDTVLSDITTAQQRQPRCPIALQTSELALHCIFVFYGDAASGGSDSVSGHATKQTKGWRRSTEEIESVVAQIQYFAQKSTDDGDNTTSFRDEEMISVADYVSLLNGANFLGACAFMDMVGAAFISAWIRNRSPKRLRQAFCMTAQLPTIGEEEEGSSWGEHFHALAAQCVACANQR